MHRSILMRPSDPFILFYQDEPTKKRGWYWQGKPAGVLNGPFDTESTAFVAAHMEMMG